MSRRRKNNSDKFDEIQRLTQLQLELHKHNIGEILKNNALTNPAKTNKVTLMAELGINAFQLVKAFKNDGDKSESQGILAKFGGNSVITKLIQSFTNK